MKVGAQIYCNKWSIKNFPQFSHVYKKFILVILFLFIKIILLAEPGWVVHSLVILKSLNENINRLRWPPKTGDVQKVVVSIFYPFCLMLCSMVIHCLTGPWLVLVGRWMVGGWVLVLCLKVRHAQAWIQARLCNLTFGIDE